MMRLVRAVRIAVTGLTLPWLSGSAAALAATDCAALRAGSAPVRIDYFQLFESDPLKAQSDPVYQEIVRDHPGEVVQYLHRKTGVLKAVYVNLMFPIEFWSGDGKVHTSVEYQSDVTKLAIAPGLSATVQGRLIDAKGVASAYVSEIAIDDGGIFKVDGCDYPVLKIVRRNHVTRDDKTTDMTAEALYSPDLKASLRLKNGPFGSLGFEILLATQVSTAVTVQSQP